MWLTSKQFREKYNISPQYLYALKKNGKVKTKPFLGSQVLILDPESSDSDKSVCIYARVSKPKQKADLENQIKFLRQYLVSKGLNPEYVYSDIASGMNEDRKGLNEMMSDIISGKISKVVISHKDRLTRFGFGYLKTIFSRYNTEIEIVNLEDEKSFQDELSEDLNATIHHFSMKFHGKRKNKYSELERNAISLSEEEDK